MTNFESFDLYAPLKRALAEQGYHTPTPIQSQSIPPAVEGTDILGCAETGTGKTAAFALPILDFIGQERPSLSPKQANALVMAPTRELAIQISDSFRNYGKHMRFRQTLVHGGVNQARQVRELSRGVDVLVATPGRLLDLMAQRHVGLDNIEMFVLDEADRMLDMGFLPALKKIIAALPKERQSLFFSATMPPKVRELAGQLLFNPLTVTVAKESNTIGQIKQSVRYVQRKEKFGLLTDRLAHETVERAIVFTRTKFGANRLTRQLERDGFRASAIHGNKSQSARQKAIEAFRQKHINILVATDIASRGIDINGVTHVVNYDMPTDTESYIHRIGRTGRAGATGTAISFCEAEEAADLQAIQRVVGKGLVVENSEAKFSITEKPKPGSKGRKPAHAKRGRGSKSRRPGRKDTQGSGKKSRSLQASTN